MRNRIFWLFVGVILLSRAVPAAAAPIYFLVTELPGHALRYDSYVLPLTEPADIAHARDLIAKGTAAGATIAFARITPGGDGINGDYLPPGTGLWSWHVTDFLGFADLGAELYDGWPGYVEQDVGGWIANTGGTIGFWGYTVTKELTIVPEPGSGCLLAGGAIAVLLWFARRLLPAGRSSY